MPYEPTLPPSVPEPPTVAIPGASRTVYQAHTYQAPPPSPPSRPSGPVPGRFLVRYGIINALLALVLGVGVSVLNVFVGRGAIPLSTVTIRALDLVVEVARYAVPSLAIIGTIATVGGWWRARAALAREAEERRAKLPLTMRGGLIGHLLLSLNLAGSLTFGAAVGSSVRVFDYSTSHECNWGTGRPTVCAFTLTNQPESTVTLRWTGVSRPGGATFQPSSGTVAPGETSQRIVVTGGYACPIVFAFRDDDQDIEIDYRFDGRCS
jgi:hypothetical protein